MEWLIQAAQLILSLSILVILHELGHFVPAKLFKTRVEKFYLFFDPWFSLFKFKRGDTEYGVGWLPLGGYVKISGMIDESMDKDQMKKPPEPWEFRSKPAWQRLIIMIGGVTVNVILGMIIYAGVLYYYGEKYLPNENVKDGLWAATELAEEVGLENGDKVLSINGDAPERFTDIVPMMLDGGSILVERNGSEHQLNIPQNFIEMLIDDNAKSSIIYPRVPFIIKSVPDSSHNSMAGLLKGDKVLAINGQNITYADEFTSFAEEHKGEQAQILIDRDGVRKDLTVQINDKGYIGVTRFIPSVLEMEKLGLYDLRKIEYGFLASFPAGIQKAIDKLGFYIKQFKLILNPETGAYKGVGGFGAIGGLFPTTWEWQVFWEITAFLSLVLAFMNILPIPALDGGHVMFLTYEILTRRKPHEKVMEYAQIAGMILLMTLLVFANGNDIVKLFN